MLKTTAVKNESAGRGHRKLPVPALFLAVLFLHAPARAQISPSPSADTSAVAIRIEEEDLDRKTRFAILAHKTNYLLPVSYVAKPNSRAYAASPDINNNLDRMEFKFQLSFKVRLLGDLTAGKTSLYAAYSQLSLWQAYNSRISAPFRETNYEPELILAARPGYELLGAKVELLTLGFNHQSNGQTEPLSRSWNRAVAGLVLRRGKNYFYLTQWMRIPERASSDDNPNMEKYYGYGELRVGRAGKSNSFNVSLRNNLRGSGNKGAVQVDWTFPLHKKLKGYLQYFDGYGETLISYNHPVSRLGLGFMLTEWL